MQRGSKLETTNSSTRELFRSGRTCGGCLLLASERAEGPGQEVLLRVIKGVSTGRAGTCSLLVAGLLVIAEQNDSESSNDLPYNDMLETFVPAGAPGSQLARGNSKLNEFRRRFEERVRREHTGIACAEISRADWGAGLPVTNDVPYPDESCVQLADSTVADLNELLS
jgi:hypothetical protein